MYLRRLILLLLLLTPFMVTLSQIKVQYFTLEYQPCAPEKAQRTRQGIPDGDKWHVFEFRKYYTTPFCETYYLDSNFTIADGNYIEYHDYKTKTVSVHGQYANGKKTGLWTTFYESGKPQDSMVYINGQLSRSVTHYQSGKLMGTILLDNAGNGSSTGTREDGSIEHTGQYTQWKKTGDWVYYNLQGVLCAKETMNADTIAGALFYDAAGKNPVTVTKDDYEKESDYPGGETAWLNYINKSLSGVTYPDAYLSGQVYGTVVVTFVVDETGNVDNIQVVQPVYPWLDQLSIKVVKRSSGKWIPARQHNRLVRSYKMQPFTFRKAE